MNRNKKFLYYFTGGTLAAMPFANLPKGNAVHAWDFTLNKARYNNTYYGSVTNTPGWSFTRASTGYAATSSGTLTSFSSGQLRRTDKGVLIEGARTNLCLQSQTFDNASWTKARSSVSADAAVAPDGTTTADKLVEDNSNNTHWTSSAAITITADSTFTVSAYFKDGGRWARLAGIDATETNYFGAYFNPSTGSFGSNQTGGTGSVTAKGVTALANGWYFVWITGTVRSGVTTVKSMVKLSSADLTSSYTGDSTSGIYLWGAQLEAAAFPSSYIPTTTASVTRAADVLTVPVSGIDYPLSLYAEFERVVDTGGTEEQLRVKYVDNNNIARIGVSGSDLSFCQATAASADQGTISTTGAISVGVTTKHAWRVSTNSIRGAKSGTLSAEDTTVTVPTGPTFIDFGSSNPSFGYLRRAALWTRALSDSELQSVST